MGKPQIQRYVCTDLTGHAEAIQLQYDSQDVTYEELLKVFWSIHNPTTRNRQGPDVGSQHRSVIFYHTPEQELSARRSIEELEKSGRFRNRIVTEVVPATPFYKARNIIRNIIKRKEKTVLATFDRVLCTNQF